MDSPPFLISVPHDRYFQDDHCANCLAPLPLDILRLFCSGWCREVAEYVRYKRKAIGDGRIRDPDVQEALLIRAAFILVGGYSALGRTLTTRTRAEVKERADGRCERCGKPGDEIDHIDGSSDDTGNLQLLCNSCHREKTSENLVPASVGQRTQLMALDLTRVLVRTPKLLADDESVWAETWRALQAERKARLEAMFRAAGVKIRSKGSHRVHLADYLRAVEDTARQPETPVARYDAGSPRFFDDLINGATNE